MLKLLRMLTNRFRLVLILVMFFPISKTAGTDNSVRVEQIALRGSTIYVQLPSDKLTLTDQEILDWVSASAESVSRYYVRFTVRHLTLRIRSRAGSGIWHGVTNANGGGSIRIVIGRTTNV